MDRELARALNTMGATRLYSHQLEAYEMVRAGKNVIVATATASGKSLCYKIPAFENALVSASNRALFLYPTKALDQDQLQKIQKLKLARVYPGYLLSRHAQGPALRAAAEGERDPYKPRHAKRWPPAEPRLSLGRTSLENLRIIAVDEAHLLRGVFGSHVAAVLRRLRRVAELHGADPRFVLTSLPSPTLWSWLRC
jgi:DEAD/DEAH box helicase domain-containing protein